MQWAVWLLLTFYICNWVLAIPYLARLEIATFYHSIGDGNLREQIASNMGFQGDSTSNFAFQLLSLGINGFEPMTSFVVCWSTHWSLLATCMNSGAALYGWDLEDSTG